jgi:two-component system sensor histidine kinase KdpD
LPGAAVTAIPLRPADDTLGVLVVAGPRGARGFDVEQRHLVEALARQAGVAVASIRHGEDARDATLRARTEELRSSLLSAVSHDLRTPLAAITGAATSLRDDAIRMPAAARAELLDSIIDEARRLERVLQNLLGITRLETGLQPIREWVAVVELCGPALARLAPVLGDRAVTVDIPPDLLVHVDPVLFEQVLLNLIENAVKHGAPPIHLAARTTGSNVTLTISDAGPGLPPGTESRAFDKFFRANPRTPGVGLGLAVVRGIVTAHGGTITAHGSTFTITLPTPPPPAPPPEP